MNGSEDDVIKLLEDIAEIRKVQATMKNEQVAFSETVAGLSGRVLTLEHGFEAWTKQALIDRAKLQVDIKEILVLTHAIKSMVTVLTGIRHAAIWISTFGGSVVIIYTFIMWLRHGGIQELLGN